MAEEDVLFFGGSFGTIQEHLPPYWNDKTTYLKDKDNVTDSYKLSPYKVLDILVYDYNKLFWLTYKFNYGNLIWNIKSKRHDVDINNIYPLCIAYLHMLV